jgi:hypothetical protein
MLYRYIMSSAYCLSNAEHWWVGVLLRPMPCSWPLLTLNNSIFWEMGFVVLWKLAFNGLTALYPRRRNSSVTSQPRTLYIQHGEKLKWFRKKSVNSRETMLYNYCEGTKLRFIIKVHESVFKHDLILYIVIKSLPTSQEAQKTKTI